LSKKEIKRAANNVDFDSGLGNTAIQLGNYTASHEMLHKLTLSHSQQAIALGTVPAGYSNAVYELQAGANDLAKAWGIFQNIKDATAQNPVQESLGLEKLRAADKEELENAEFSDVAQATPTVHGESHKAAVQTWKSTIPIVGDLINYIHLGHVMDAFSEIGQLRPAMRFVELKKVKTKS
jgi:hypothetical protein